MTAHIAEARAEGAVSESDVRDMLTRLGSPDEIVAAATDGLVLVDAPPRLRRRDVVALMFLACGGLLWLGGWLIGVALLWTSDRWTRREKLLGTLFWPFGYAIFGFLLDHAPHIDIPIWPARVGWLVIFVSQTAILSLLFQNARPKRASRHS